jgi:hypothetical protein
MAVSVLGGTGDGSVRLGWHWLWQCPSWVALAMAVSVLGGTGYASVLVSRGIGSATAYYGVTASRSDLSSRVLADTGIASATQRAQGGRHTVLAETGIASATPRAQGGRHTECPCHRIALAEPVPSRDFRDWLCLSARPSNTLRHSRCHRPNSHERADRLFATGSAGRHVRSLE